MGCRPPSRVQVPRAKIVWGAVSHPGELTFGGLTITMLKLYHIDL